MISAEEFLKDIKSIQCDYKSNNYITKDDEKTRIEIIQYILSNKTELNYSQRVFQKLENVLADLLKRGV